ncbi:MAG: phosphoribosyl-AMP cyclohydrolase [Deltaproteobacteria bacterium RBG_16_54_11]|nr:MAG: phosphoribosyl-AMP cyclohydrolase [Deltaproteobacteria bacterium RBG_16_54_11]
MAGVGLKFDKLGGLVPVVVQDYTSGEVLMLAFMNRQAWEQTLRTRQATYWSRSRNELWVKGETSGNLQEVKEIYVDCDEDTVLLKVIQQGGGACHTGRRCCFYRRVEGDELKEVGERVFDPEEAYR